jgi:hypothetical protein
VKTSLPGLGGSISATADPPTAWGEAALGSARARPGLAVIARDPLAPATVWGWPGSGPSP